MEDKDPGKIETWAIVEVFGHTKLAGFLRTVPLGSAAMLRIDVPEVVYSEREYKSGDVQIVERKIAPFTKFYSPASIFSITPCTEETARMAMRSWHVEPIQYFELRQLPAPTDLEPDDENEIDADFERAEE
jgi:hypothetical protein